MKHEVSLLKKRKQKLRKKVVSERNEKRAINKKIKMLKETTQKRQVEESNKFRVEGRNREAGEMMIDDD